MRQFNQTSSAPRARAAAAFMVCRIIPLAAQARHDVMLLLPPPSPACAARPRRAAAGPGGQARSAAAGPPNGRGRR
jgi:hypothetical protein